MSIRNDIRDAGAGRKNQDGTVRLDVGNGHTLEIYPESIHDVDGATILVARENDSKHMYVVSDGGESGIASRFEGEQVDIGTSDDEVVRCSQSHANAEAIRNMFDFARPVLIGTEDSFGFGDRLGVANPAHLRSLEGSGFRAILAQQSIRELERTERTPDDVMDAATWAVLQEGFHEGFGADADHLKTTEHIDWMAAAGFTMYTLDPGDHVVNEADDMSPDVLASYAEGLPWDALEDTLANTVNRYADREIVLPGDVILNPSREQVLRALAKYGASIAHARLMYDHLANTLSAGSFEVEVSVDETGSVTTPFEHYLFASELNRLGVEFIGMAPRFIGEFEKGIDYHDDIDLFLADYQEHMAVAEALGDYKISIHSGSDKFTIYRAIGELGRGHTHIKTAGTSYLEALRTASICDPELFREILDFSRALFQEEQRSYRVAAKLERVPTSDTLSDVDLPLLLEQDDSRQVLHVAFGRVLSERDPNGLYLFKDRLLTCLVENESTHDEIIENHFRRHLEPFSKATAGTSA